MKLDVGIRGMHCASCVATIEKAARETPGVKSAAVNLATERAQLEVDDTFDSALLEKRVASAGYRVLLPSSLAVPEVAESSLPMMIAIPCAAIVMTFGMLHVAMWVQFALATIVQFGCGWKYHVGFLKSLRRVAADMDTLISLGTNVAYFASAVTLLRGGHEVYFETSTAIIATVLLGRWLELKARRGTNDAVRALAALIPKEAATLKPGDVIRVKPGERIGADGVIASGSTSIDESFLTGESLPVDRKPGDRVLGGSVNGTGSIEVKITAAGEATVLSQIRRIVTEAQGSKAKVQRLADRIASVFVPAVLLIAGVTLAGWLMVGRSDIALQSLVAVLIVACPCALGLATPTAVMVAVGSAARMGILIKSAGALEALGSLPRIAFDKTGTLTLGRPAVKKAHPEALRLAAAVERHSEHPIARGILAACSDAPTATDFQARPGFGAIATVDGHAITIGNATFMEILDVKIPAEELPPGHTVVHVASDGAYVGAILLADTPRDDAAPTVAELKSLGLEVWMISGDTQQTAESVAKTVGVANIKAGVQPADKAAVIAALKPIAMVGDGINDAPALAAADVGIAVKTGTDVAIESADVVLMSGGLLKIPASITLARRARRIILENFAWAAGYNVVLIPLAAGLLRPFGLRLDPMWAGVAMALSSVSVVMNSLRLRK